MGKRLIQQRRGKGSIRFRAPKHTFVGKAAHRKMDALEEDVCKGVVRDILHCPAHTGPLLVIEYQDGIVGFEIAPENIRVGDELQSGINAEAINGNVVPLSKIPEGTLIFNIESNPGDGGKFVRGAGTAAKVVSKTGNTVKVELPSKKKKDFNSQSRAMIGRVAGTGKLEKPLVKAGTAHYKHKARNKFWPIVCGQSMNAVAHPHGGKRSSKKNYAYAVSRHTPPGAKVGAIAARRTGKKK